MSGSRRPSLDNSATPPASFCPLRTPIRMLLGVCRAFVTAVIINSAVLRFHLVRVHLLALLVRVCVCVCLCVPMLYVFVCLYSLLTCFVLRRVLFLILLSPSFPLSSSVLHFMLCTR